MRPACSTQLNSSRLFVHKINTADNNKANTIVEYLTTLNNYTVAINLLRTTNLNLATINQLYINRKVEQSTPGRQKRFAYERSFL